MALSNSDLRKRRSYLDAAGSSSLRSTLIKILILGLVNAVAVFFGFIFFLQQNWGFLIGLILLVLVVNFVYFHPRLVPAKYLVPGLILLVFFQLYVVVFSGYIAFTNYGSAHNGSREDAITAIKQSAYIPLEAGPYYYLSLARDGNGDLTFLMAETETGKTYAGSNQRPLTEVSLEVDEFGNPIASGEFTAVSPEESNTIQEEIIGLRVPVPDKPQNFIATSDALTAQMFEYDLVFDEAAQTFTRNSDGVVFAPAQDGFFRSTTTDERLPTGWRVEVGLKNFETIFLDETLRPPLLKIITWTFIFSIGSVVSTFILGLALALLMNDSRIKGQKLYRGLIILPYAFPVFLSAYVWRGLFDTDNGFINMGLLGGAEVPWLETETLARIAVLIVNLWLGFPYMFLISTGALQAIPGELIESAKIDGASVWQQFSLVKLPLLLVSLAPLLIASFAFNFNNFTLIYLLTGGGPSSGDARLLVDPGGTDILITFVYKIAFASSDGRDYGLASAFSILIFVLIGTLSWLSFRRTKALEEINA